MLNTFSQSRKPERKQQDRAGIIQWYLGALKTETKLPKLRWLKKKKQNLIRSKLVESLRTYRSLATHKNHIYVTSKPGISSIYKI